MPDLISAPAMAKEAGIESVISLVRAQCILNCALRCLSWSLYLHCAPFGHIPFRLLSSALTHYLILSCPIYLIHSLSSLSCHPSTSPFASICLLLFRFPIPLAYHPFLPLVSTLLSLPFSPFSLCLQGNPENIGSPYWNLLSVGVTRADGTKSVITGASSCFPLHSLLLPQSAYPPTHPPQHTCTPR